MVLRFRKWERKEGTKVLRNLENGVTESRLDNELYYEGKTLTINVGKENIAS